MYIDLIITGREPISTVHNRTVPVAKLTSTVYHEGTGSQCLPIWERAVGMLTN